MYRIQSRSDDGDITLRSLAGTRTLIVTQAELDERFSPAHSHETVRHDA
jgi:hypothetical protein